MPISEEESTFVIVDPGGTSGYWYRTIMRNFPNGKVIAVWSNITAASKNSKSIVHNHKFDLEIIDTDKINEILSNQTEITAILPCSDSGVYYAEKLKQTYTPHLAHSDATCDIISSKINVYQFLKERDIIKTNQWIINKNTKNFSFLKWDREYILKPLDGSGGDRFASINSLSSLQHFMTHQDPSTNFIIQEKVFGTECSIDMVSINGMHRLVAMWRYTKNTKKHIKDEVDLIRLPVEGHPLVTTAVTFVKQCLDAIGWKWGPTHTEVMITKNGEVNLIEINFRLHGHLDESLQLDCLGTSQPYEVLAAYSGISNVQCDNFSYFTRKNCKKIFLNNQVERFIDTVDYQTIKEQIPFNFSRFYAAPNILPGIAPVTSSVQTCLGVLVMVQNSNDSIWEYEIEVARNWKELLVNVSKVL